MQIGRTFFVLALLGLAPAVSTAQDAGVPAPVLSAVYNNHAPAFGNPGGDVTVVEFYDYQCSYCKASEKGLEQLLQEDKNLKIIFMDFPKLGPLSVTAATATLASRRQGMDKYLRFHFLLMNEKRVTAGNLYQFAATAGLDVDRLKQDMSDPEIARYIQDSITLGKSVGVRVTPSFIVGGRFYPGYAPYDRLKQMVDYARSGGR